VLLDEVDKALQARGYSFARYADDCNVYVARRVRIVVVPIELTNERAAMKDFSGSIRTSIQRQSGVQRLGTQVPGL